MPFPTFLAAVAKEPTSVLDAVPHLTGMLMVLSTLAILWGVCALNARLIQLFVPEAKSAAAPIVIPPAASAACTVSPPIAAPEGIAPELVAVIAAAVAVATGESHRIISIKPMSSSWERAGRQSVLTSHRIR